MILLILNFFLLKEDSQVIDQNKVKIEDASLVKVKMTEVISNIHLLDLGIRGYALSGMRQIENSIDSANTNRGKIHATLAGILKKQGFSMAKIDLLKDTVNGYFAWINHIHSLLKEGKKNEAITLIGQDRGYNVWQFYKGLTKEINSFEDGIAMKARTQYQIALRNSYLLQILLALLIIPTLIYLVYSAIRAFNLTEKLLQSEAEKNNILNAQNEQLERLVQERTYEIASQNEEIQTHNDRLIAQQEEIEHQTKLLTARNQQLEEASQIISQQKQIIEKENLQLTVELAQQNKELLSSNHELVLKNNRIEQFAYTISHNLRAPIARIIGLTNIFKHAHTKEEIDSLMSKTGLSAMELDQVVRDLSGIMQIQRFNTEIFSEIDFETTLQKAKQILENEIRETSAKFYSSFDVKSIYSSPPYIDSVFYNLISNSLKYRHPERIPKIKISNEVGEDFLTLKFSDNGLGMETKIYKENIFGLYKRFHSHVEGRGIGLYLVKTQIEMLGGKIEVTSTPNEGTAFKISLPLKL